MYDFILTFSCSLSGLALILNGKSDERLGGIIILFAMPLFSLLRLVKLELNSSYMAWVCFVEFCVLTSFVWYSLWTKFVLPLVFTGIIMTRFSISLWTFFGLSISEFVSDLSRYAVLAFMPMVLVARGAIKFIMGMLNYRQVR